MFEKRSKIFILGGGGFLGGALHSRLANDNYDVVNIGPQSRALENGPNVTIIDSIIEDYSMLEPYLSSSNIFYYLINTSSPATSATTEGRDIMSNVAGLVDFCRFLQDVPNSRVVFTSSGGTVYGNTEYIPTPERSSTNPISLYGMTKLACEQYLKLFAEQSDFKYVVARISNPYGPSQVLNREQGLIPAVLKNITESNPISIIGDGQSVRDYIYIDDVVEALCLCGIRHALSNQTVNIGSGDGRSVMEVVWEVAKHLEETPSFKALPARIGDVKTNVLDVSKINSLVGWLPKVSFEVGVQMTVDAFLKNL